jgi:hypothetical protein
VPFPEYSAYLYRIERADERTRTADLLITSGNRSPVGGVQRVRRVRQFPINNGENALRLAAVLSAASVAAVPVAVRLQYVGGWSALAKPGEALRLAGTPGGDPLYA